MSNQTLTPTLDDIDRAVLAYLTHLRAQVSTPSYLDESENAPGLDLSVETVNADQGEMPDHGVYVTPMGVDVLLPPDVVTAMALECSGRVYTQDARIRHSRSIAGRHAVVLRVLPTEASA